ncbi:hypothetical protein EC991_001087 [Linnemannia zychae]|nr:hypothetical protein EC991_001087 [Linnemannia zychae]
MEDLLARMPNLEELKLISLCHMDSNIWDWPRFQKHLQSLSLPLKQFYYSHLLIPSVDEDQEEAIAAVCPNATERSMSLYSFTPKVIKILINQPTVLSSLVILLPVTAICRREGGWAINVQDPGSDYTARSLHQLLCEGSTLRHLKTLKMPYMVDFMDIHRRHTNHITDEELQDIADGWTQRMEDETALDARRLESRSTEMEMTILGDGVDDVELMDSLKNLGLLVDVKEMVKEMIDPEFVCLPELRRLACGRHLEQSPEKEISSVFHDTSPVVNARRQPS